ncbi:hypothetical protein [Paenibacillus lemnae]|uniref:Uncharacterized protein n=1 Tax=Paenibacillus lemnae TaxID=1330551 RepID=A0A848M925_PAELE|nr:hypothetical protein [Paenibacillus lemnae]NMO97165.1 hypothetical protein [Paenibacillus lemnae]
MGRNISFILLLFLCSFPFSLTNFLPFFKDLPPDPRHMMTSLLAGLLVLITGLVMGLNDQRFFLRWYSGYWLTGLVLLLLGLITKAFVLFIPIAFLYVSPFYGLHDWLNISSQQTLLFALPLAAWMIGMVGYGAGILFQAKKQPGAES